MNKIKTSKYFTLAITLFVVGAALILFYRIATHIEGFREILHTMNTILFPFILGAALAYLLAPIYNIVVSKTYSITSNKLSKSNAMTLARTLGSIVAMTVLIGFFVISFSMVVPQLVESIVGLVKKLPEYINILTNWVVGIVDKVGDENLSKAIENTIENGGDQLLSWFKTNIVPNLSSYASNLSEGAMFTATLLMNIVIGILVALYLLNEKEIFMAQTKKIILAMTNEDRANSIFRFGDYTNRVFGKYINGKILDSLIVGVLCFIIMSIIGIPYAVLVSTIVGVTNIIPFFGPFIGAIPCTFIIVMVNPMQALYFVIMVFLLQQLDGNIIQPIILSGATGLSSFWVMFAILVGGGLFGITGMILGVPVFAVMYYYIGIFISKNLQKKDLPYETSHYESYEHYDISLEEQDLIELDYKQKAENKIDKKISRKFAKEQKKEMKIQNKAIRKANRQNKKEKKNNENN